MKSKKRIHQDNDIKPAPIQVKTSKPSFVIADDPNILIEPELLVEVREWDAKKRLYLAEKFARWSAQLAASARQMDSTIVKDIPEPAQLPKGFMLINMSQREKRELQEMAKEANIELRVILKNALFHATQMLADDLKRMRLMGTTRWELAQKLGLFFRSENN